MIKDKEFWIWFAGFVDGEGCFQLVKHKVDRVKRGYSWASSLTISQYSEEFLNDLKFKIGFGNVILQEKNDARLSFSAGHLRKILPHFIEYLKVRKQEALYMKEALELVKQNRITKDYYANDKRLNKLFKLIRNCHKISARKRRKWK